jgi:membrane protein
MDTDAAFSGEQPIDAHGFRPERGRLATAPQHIDWEGWKDVLWRVWNEFNRDRVMLVAAGATFYLLLAAFPAMAVLVSLFGLIGNPVRMADQLSLLSGVLPASTIDFVSKQLTSLAAQNHATLTFGFAFSFLVALWSAIGGVKTLFEAMNIAYEETEKRSFLRYNLFALLFTLGAMAVSIVFVVAIGVVPLTLSFIGLSQFTKSIIAFARWPILLLVAGTAISILYRYGPSREHAKWRWITLGSAVATLLWLLTAALFSWYLANFANYNATYGSLGAVAGFMMWMWVSLLVLIMGAELDAEAEHQTVRDSTTGPEMPMGQRGATMADTVGRQRGAPADQRPQRVAVPHASSAPTQGGGRPSEAWASPTGGGSRNRGQTLASGLIAAAWVGAALLAMAVGWTSGRRGQS